jgi:hypothetical protein
MELSDTLDTLDMLLLKGKPVPIEMEAAWAL